MDDKYSNYEYEEDKADEDEDEDSEIDYGNYEDEDELEELLMLKEEIKDDNIKPDEEQDIDEALNENELDKDDEVSLDEIDEEDEDVYKDDTKTEIVRYKEENIKTFSPLGMISYLCNLVDYIKNGNVILDGRTEFDYPNETEESYAIESVLLDTNPFIYIIKDKKIKINQIDKIMCLKIVLRCVDENKSIFFTKVFTEKFPVFVKSLYNNYVSQEELNEINEIRKRYNLIP